MFKQRINWFSKHPRAVGVIFVVTIVLSFSTGSVYGKLSNTTITLEDGSVIGVKAAQQLSSDVDFQMFWDVWQSVQNDYLRGPVPEKDLFYSALEGLVKGTGDQYTTFFDPEAAEEFQTDLSGQFEGIGAQIGKKNDRIVVIAPLPESPAVNSGLMAGDIIFLIDDIDTTDMSVDEAVSRIRGVGGTEVVLTVARESSGEIAEIPIIRDVIEVASVKWEVREDKIAKIDIYSFNKDTALKFNEAVADIQEQGATGIVLDMRNNPGGFLDRAVSVVGEWVGNKTVVFERADGDHVTPFNAQGIARIGDIPTVVLVNGGSASAAEIVAGALQDYEKATIVGTQTFGKGSVQEYQSFKDGSGLKITIAEWLTPKGRSIQDEGITPDEYIEYTQEDFDAERDPQLDKAIEILSIH